MGKSYILEFIFGHKWAIYRPALNAMVEIVERVLDDPIAISQAFHGTQYNKYLSIDNTPVKNALLPSVDYPKLENTFEVRLIDNVAIIPVTGVIFPRRASVPMSFGAHTTLARLSHDINEALKSDLVKSIIMVYDSPGGEVTGVSEMASMIFKGNAQKSIISYVYGMGASAGYFLASAGSEIIASDMSEVGSLGVVAEWIDTTKREEKQGVKRHEIVSNLSPNKRPDLNTDEGAQQLQKVVDDLATVFVQAVAIHRGISFEEVLDKYGQGKMFVAKAAQEQGMIDRISTLDELIKEQTKLHKPSTYFQGGSFMNLTELKEQHPKLYQQVVDDAKLVGMEEGGRIGADEERARIKGIFGIKVKGYEELISENAFNPEMTSDKVSALILAEQEKKREQAGKDTTEDALDAAEQAKKIKQDDGSSSQAEEDAAVDQMVRGANTGRK